MTIRLPKSLTVEIRGDETVMSFVSRVALLNRRPQNAFCRDMGVDPQRLASGESVAVERMSHVTHTDASKLSARTFVNLERNRYRFGTEILAVQGLDFQGMRFCPHCVRSDIEHEEWGPMQVRPYRRASWLLASYRVCSRHRTALVKLDGLSGLDFAASIQPFVNRSVDYEETRVCDCGFEDYVDARLAGVHVREHWLDGFRLDAAGRLCEILGACDLFPGRTITSLDDAEIASATQRGFEACSEGADSVAALLGNVQGRLQVPPLTPKQAWPTLYRYLTDSTDPEFDKLRDLIFHRAVQTMPYGPGDVLFDRMVETRTMHSVRSAAVELGTHATRLRRLLQKGGIILEAQADLTNEQTLFSASEAREFLELVDGALPMQAAVRYLNLPQGTGRRLMVPEFIEPLVGTTEGSLTQYSFPRVRLDAYLGSLTQNAVLLGAGEKQFRRIAEAAVEGPCRLDDIVRMLFQSVLRNVRIDLSDRGFQSVLVDMTELEQISQAKSGISKRQAGRTINVSTKVVSALIANGQILTMNLGKPMPGGRDALDPESVERFARRYVSLVNLCVETGIHHAPLQRTLEEHGIEPAFPKENVHTRFYERDRLPNLSL